jgi:hypothetical protein
MTRQPRTGYMQIVFCPGAEQRPRRNGSYAGAEKGAAYAAASLPLSHERLLEENDRNSGRVIA